LQKTNAIAMLQFFETKPTSYKCYEHICGR